jgi:hypothetical protein
MKEVISMTYNDEQLDFEVHYWDLWEWAADLLQDLRLFLHFTFDAQHLSKFDGENFVHFIDKPYMAQAFWDLQVCIYVISFPTSCLPVATTSWC